MAKVHTRIAEQILKAPGDIIQLSVTNLAERANASEASVVLLCKRLGFRGFHDFKIGLAEELYQSSADIHEEIVRTDDTSTVIKKVFNTSIQALKDSLHILDQKSVAEAAQSIVSGNKILIMGIGISGMIAKDFWMKLYRIKLNAHYYDEPTTVRMAASLSEPDDVIFVISHSGSTKVIIEAIREAGQRGTKIIGLTNFIKSPISRYVTTLLLTSSRETGVREEEMTGRIAQLAVIDTLFVSIANLTYSESIEALKKTRAAVSDDKF
jgi:DNA-binding MurR/RpiR family transcriptional regulator